MLKTAFEKEVAPKPLLDQISAIIDEKSIKPLVYLYKMEGWTTKNNVDIKGVVFNNFPVEKVMVGKSRAILRAATEKDINELPSQPKAQFGNKVYFEVKEYPLEDFGENAVIVKAFSRGSSKDSNITEISIIRRPSKSR